MDELDLMGEGSGLSTFGDDARVHEGGQGEVGDDEECDDALVGRHPGESVQVELASGRERSLR